MGYQSYQWQLNGIPIPGAINSYYRPTVNGNYSVTVTDSFCSQTSIQSYFSIGIQDALNGKMLVSPNPFDQKIQIEIQEEIYVEGEITLIDLLGRTIWAQKLNPSAQNTSITLETTEFRSGTYFLLFQFPTGMTGLKIIKR